MVNVYVGVVGVAVTAGVVATVVVTAVGEELTVTGAAVPEPPFTVTARTTQPPPDEQTFADDVPVAMPYTVNILPFSVS